jgi:hypothetical protein
VAFPIRRRRPSEFIGVLSECRRDELSPPGYRTHRGRRRRSRQGRRPRAGSPAAALDADGTFFVAYRIRIGKPPEGRAATVVARSEDGERLATVATLDMDRFGAFSIERPAIVRTESGRWRLPSSPATSTWP